MGSFMLKPCSSDNSYKIVPHEKYTKEEMVSVFVEKLDAEIVADTKFLAILILDGLKISVSRRGEIMIRDYVKEEHATRLAKKIMDALESE